MNLTLIEAFYHGAIFMFVMIAIMGLCIESVLRR